MKTVMALAVGAFFTFGSGIAASDENKAPAYSADELVSFMIDQADLGSARALCIGTRSECAQQQEKPKGFDMMLTFDLDSAELRPDAMANLEVVAAALQDSRIKAAKFMVEGHTDAKGEDGYNMDLSKARARAVTDFLVARNVDPRRIIAVGHGEAMPRTGNPYDAENRRVELSLTVQ